MDSTASVGGNGERTDVRRERRPRRSDGGLARAAEAERASGGGGGGGGGEGKSSPSVLKGSNDGERNTSEAREGRAATFTGRLRERSRVTGEFCRAALYGRPRTAAGEKVGLAIQLNRKGRKEDCGGGTERERGSFLPSFDGDATGGADFSREWIEARGTTGTTEGDGGSARSSWGLESSPGES